MQSSSRSFQNRAQTKGSYRPILLKKSVSEKAIFRQLKKRPIAPLLLKNRYNSAFLSEADFDVAHTPSWANRDETFSTESARSKHLFLRHNDQQLDQ